MTFEWLGDLANSFEVVSRQSDSLVQLWHHSSTFKVKEAIYSFASIQSYCIVLSFEYISFFQPSWLPCLVLNTANGCYPIRQLNFSSLIIPYVVGIGVEVLVGAVIHKIYLKISDIHHHHHHYHTINDCSCAGNNSKTSCGTSNSSCCHWAVVVMVMVLVKQ